MSVTAYTAPELAKLRARPQAFPVYLAVHRPATLLTATLASVPGWPSDGTGAGELALTGISVTSAPKAGATVRLGTDARNLLRVRADYSGTPIKVAATSQNALNLAIGTTVTVLDDYRPAPKRLRWDGSAWYSDFDTAYTDQGTNIGPVAIMGPSAIATISGSAGSSSFSFDGSRSYTVDGATIASYAWTFPDGTTASGSSATFTTSTDYADGGWVKLVVTDSNGKTQTTRRPLWRFSSVHAPQAVVMDSMSGDWGGGWETQVTVYGTAGSAAYPVGAHVALFTAATYSGSAGDIGGNFGSSRANILFDGWITDVRTSADPYNSWVELTSGTIDKLLARQVAFPVSLNDSASPASWVDVKDLTLNKAAVISCKYFSNVLEVADFYVCGQQTATVAAAQTDTKKYQDLDKGTLWEQLQSNYAWIYGAVSSDAQSGLWAEQDAIVGKFGASLPVMFALANGDIRDKLEIIEAEHKLSGQVTVYGVDYDVPIGSRAPDDPPDYAQEIGSPEAKHHCTQAQANTWAGGLRAKLNNPYPSVTLPLSTGFRLDPAPQCAISWTPSATNRDPAWTAKPLIVRRVSYALDGAAGSLLPTIECEPNHTESDGVGVTFDVPGEPTTPIVPTPINPVPPSSTGTGYVTVATADYIGATSNFTDASPNWTNKTGAITGTIADYILDPWQPTNNAFVGASTGIWRTQTLGQAAPVWYNVLTASAFLAATGQALTMVQAIRATIAQQGRLYCLALGSTNAYVGVTSDGGNTWLFISLGSTTAATDLHGLAASQHNAGTVLAACGAGKLYRSIDFGATFSLAYTVGGASKPIANIELPYEGNGSDLLVLISVSGGGVIGDYHMTFSDYVPGPVSGVGFSNVVASYFDNGFTVRFTASTTQEWKRIDPQSFNWTVNSGYQVGDAITMRTRWYLYNPYSACLDDWSAIVASGFILCGNGFQMSRDWDENGYRVTTGPNIGLPALSGAGGNRYPNSDMRLYLAERGTYDLAFQTWVYKVGDTIVLDDPYDTDRILKTTDGFATAPTDITPAAGAAVGGHGLLSSTVNSTYLYALAGASGSTALAVSTDSGGSWTDNQTGLTGAVAIGGWPYTTTGLYWLEDTATGIRYSGNSGSTAVDKTGDWGSAIDTFTAPVNIIPDWTK